MGRIDDVKEPPISDREAMICLQELKKYISDSQKQMQRVLDVAIRALEDKILLEDDGR